MVTFQDSLVFLLGIFLVLEAVFSVTQSNTHEAIGAIATVEAKRAVG